MKLNVDDIFTLIARADELNILSKLPTFVAADPDKLPNMNPEALDVCILVKKLASLEQTVMRHEAQFGACTGMMSIFRLSAIRTEAHLGINMEVVM